MYARININAQEVFTVGTFDCEPFFSWHLAESPLAELPGRAWRKLVKKYGLTSDEHRYVPGGQDQLHVEVDGSSRRCPAPSR